MAAHDPKFIKAVWRLIVAFQAQRAGLDPAYVFRVEGSQRASGSWQWQSANGCRQLAVYMAHTLFGFSYSELAKVSGISRPGISRIIHKVEDAREDNAFGQWLDQVEQAIHG